MTTGVSPRSSSICPPMRTAFRMLALAASLALGCSWGTGPGPGSPEEIAYILLIDQNGTDDTAHLPLYPASPTTLQVRLYRANRTEITSVPGGSNATFTFTPPSLASVQPTADSMGATISATDSVGAGGTFNVTLRFPTDTLIKTFGPFSVLIH